MLFFIMQNNVHFSKASCPSDKEDDILYHGSPYVMGSAIEPRECPTVTNEEERAYVFAGESWVAAHGYALKTKSCRSVGIIEDTNGKYGFSLIEDREKFLNENTTGKIYTVPKNLFQSVPNKDPSLGDTGEWVSESPIPIQDKNIRTVTLSDAMRAGMQFFFLKDPDEIDVLKELSQNPTIQAFDKFLREGKITCENIERDINPLPALSNKPRRQNVTIGNEFT